MPLKGQLKNCDADKCGIVPFADVTADNNQKNAMQKLFSDLRALLEQPSSAPRYMQLAHMLEHCLHQRSDLAGQFLPPERQLVQLLGLSRVTVSRSLALLEEKGLIIRQQGVGTRIAPLLDYSLDEDESGFTALVQQQGGSAGNIWLARQTDIAAPEGLALLLPTLSSLRMTKLYRVRLLNDEPASLESTWIPLHLLPTPEDVETSLYQYWAARGIFPGRKQFWLKALGAPDDVASHLKIPTGAPVTFHRQLTYGDKGELLEYCEIFCRSDMYEFHVSC
ncbi:transcriptional regulator, GntR family [Musicola paradisiaca Ech703]|uniref:Transcriptional regulator, GntR family n=2 Tax=Musicola paradisiaca TaxID=69223 RepID=C6C436_MUSP7|nr:transcriptional regulator, GntR family [Musicola paradisiaca Ech703]